MKRGEEIAGSVTIAVPEGPLRSGSSRRAGHLRVRLVACERNERCPRIGGVPGRRRAFSRLVARGKELAHEGEQRIAEKGPPGHVRNGVEGLLRGGALAAQGPRSAKLEPETYLLVVCCSFGDH